jgi:hypothetical protein
MENHPASHLQEGLLQAFIAADYRVSIAGHELSLRIGRTHPELDRALGHRAWAIVTACNPGGRLADEDDNQRRQLALEKAIGKLGWPYWRGRNLDPQNAWPEEPSLLIADADVEAIMRLAARFGQAAIVTGQPGACAELRPCR